VDRAYVDKSFNGQSWCVSCQPSTLHAGTLHAHAVLGR
jgi:hypothetical protein